MKKTLSVILPLIFMLALFSCGTKEEKPVPEEYYSSSFFAMDTKIEIRLARYSGDNAEGGAEYFDDSELEEIVSECKSITDECEALFSRTLEGSV
ncbi:MAG: hypothetical protein IJQ80_04600, partial [Clostridia bacterium]|nr:hypothetical protein [Clostridia bacterium]